MKTPMRTMQVALACLGIAAAGAAGARAQDWPQWRGVNRDAHATGFNAPQTWPKELVRKWSVEVGEGDATPALTGGKLYVFSRQGGNEVVRCLDAASGKELWQDKYESLGATGPASGHSGPRSSPVVAGGKVVTYGVRGVLSCLDEATGAKVWRKDDFAGSWPNFFTASSPLIVDGICVAQQGGANNGTTVAYDLSTGAEKWRWAGDGAAYASPVVMTLGSTRVVIAETDKRIVALRVADGKLVWETPYGAAGMRSYNAATPIVDGATLIVAGSGRGTKALQLSASGDSLASTDRWSNDNSVQFGTPVLKSGLVYGVSDKDMVFCVNAQSGQPAWTAPSGGKRGFGSVVDAGAVLLVLTPSSQLLVLQPGDKQFQQIASYPVAQSEVYAYPVPAGRGIYVKDQQSVTLWGVE